MSGMNIVQTFIFTLLIKDRQTVHSYVSQLRQKKTRQRSFGCMTGVKALHILILLHFLGSIDCSPMHFEIIFFSGTSW